MRLACVVRLLTLSLTAILCVVLVAGDGDKKSSAPEDSDFPRVYNTEKAKGLPLPAEEAAETVERPSGFNVSVFAAEPDVRQPIALTTDNRGRLWISENYIYDADPKLGFAKDLRDRIVILEDSDQDGRFDRRKVFWDGARNLSSVELGFGGVWALCAPHLLFIPDRNRDDVPDSKPEILLEGWNDDSIQHNIVSGLTWGPDGWLYGRHGIHAHSEVGKPGEPRVRLNCCIWRYHPTRHVFDIVCVGATNPWGFDYNERGQMFFTNTVNGHLWHVIPGAHYARPNPTDLNPYVYDFIDQCADHYHFDIREKWHDIRQGVTETTQRSGGGHAHCGLMIYLGDNWPDRYRDTLMTINFHGQRVNTDRSFRKGAGYVAKHGEDMLFFKDSWFRGLELIYGPDGGVFIADWSDTGECHERTGVHRTSGRIYKVTYGRPRRHGKLDLASRSNLELVELQLHKNDWYVRHARRLLQERAALGRDMSDARDALLRMYREQTDVTRQLRAMWCLYALGGLESAWLEKQLEQPNEHLRAWAVRLLADSPSPPTSSVGVLEKAAREDPSGLVRTFIASLLQQLPASLRWPIATGLVQRSDLAADPVLPQMIWYGVESAVPENPEQAVTLAERSVMRLVRRNIARRLTSDIDTNIDAVERLVALLSPRKEPDFPEFQLDILRGMLAALHGRRKAPAPAAWSSVATSLLEGSSGDSSAADTSDDLRDTETRDDVQAVARELALIFGDGRVTKELQTIVTDREADPTKRRTALRALASTRSNDLVKLLHELTKDSVLASQAVSALASYDHPETPGHVLASYKRLDAAGRVGAVNTLVSRPTYARTLLRAVSDGKIPRRDLSAYHARQIRSFSDEGLNGELARLWGEVRTTPAEKRKRIDDYKAFLDTDRLTNANLPQGRVLFDKTCGSCHLLYGQGTQVGPDLTGSDRRNLDYLLENLIDPSALVPADFQMSIVVLKNGAVLTGVIVEQSKKTLTVQTQKERIAVEREEIEAIRKTTQSLMPDGLINNLTREQVRDLSAYLMTSKQVPLPATDEE